MSLTELQASISGPTPEPQQDTGNPSEEIGLTDEERQALEGGLRWATFLSMQTYDPETAKRYLAYCRGVELPPAPRRYRKTAKPRPKTMSQKQQSILANAAAVRKIVQRRILMQESLCWTEIMGEAGLHPTWITGSKQGTTGWNLKQEIREMVEQARAGKGRRFVA